MGLGQLPCRCACPCLPIDQLAISSQTQAAAESVILYLADLLVRQKGNSTPDSRMIGGKEILAEQACFPHSFPSQFQVSHKITLQDLQEVAVSVPEDGRATSHSLGLQVHTALRSACYNDRSRAAVRSGRVRLNVRGKTISKPPHYLPAWLSLFNYVRQRLEQPRLCPLVIGDGRCCFSTALARSSCTVLPASSLPRRQRRQHRPPRRNIGKMPVSKLKAKTCSQSQMEAHRLRSCSRTRW